VITPHDRSFAAWLDRGSARERRGKLCAGFDFEFAEGVAQVHLDRTLRHEQGLGDLPAQYVCELPSQTTKRSPTLSALTGPSRWVKLRVKVSLA
jgi:hypothetical protein